MSPSDDERPTVATSPPLLASDAEREQVVALLHRALADGRLDMAEAEARVAEAYAARHRDDLAPLLADLPDADPYPSTSGSRWEPGGSEDAAYPATSAPRPRSRRRVVAVAATVGVLALGGAGAAVVGHGGHRHGHGPDASSSIGATP